MLEISITMLSDELKLVKKELLFTDEIIITKEDGTLKKLVEDAVSTFPGQKPDEVRVRINFEW